MSTGVVVKCVNQPHFASGTGTQVMLETQAWRSKGDHLTNEVGRRGKQGLQRAHGLTEGFDIVQDLCMLGRLHTL